jgi:hypothetical protein
MPVLERLAAPSTRARWTRLSLLIDRLPQILQSVDEELLPLARGLKDVGPELHSLLALAEDLHDTLSKVPGMGLVRRRREADSNSNSDSDS